MTFLLHLQDQSLFGPFFNVSAIPDYRPFSYLPQPDVRQQCFSDLENRRQADVLASIQGLRSSSGILHTGLHTAVHSLLKNKDTRVPMLDWLQQAIASNAERAKMQIDFQVAATHGLFCNLCSVMLKLCEPFIDPSSGKAWQRLDVAYVTMGDGRVDFKEDTKLGVSSEEEAGWVERRKASLGSSGASSGGNYHFIADCFFMTARAMHIGIVKVMGESKQQAMDMHRLQRDLRELEGAQSSTTPGTPQASMLEERIRRYKAAMGKHNEVRLCFETALHDPATLQSVLAYYRLMAVWLMRLASPSTAVGT
jgi:ubiquitin conjugation factor E4 B